MAALNSTGNGIAVDGLGKVYGSHAGEGVRALEDVTFDVDGGEFFSVVGPSGCGKSTLLRIIAKLLDASEGSFEITDATATDQPENAMVFQEAALFPWRTVQQNVEFGLEMRGIDKAERASVARKYIEKVGLGGFEAAYPSELSGGMKQRVNIARAFAVDSKVLLMDEPLGALDAQTQHILQEELLQIWKEEQKTVVFVTHSIEEAILMSDRIALMSARPGHLTEIYDVDLERPRSIESRNTAAFNELYQDIWDSLETEVQASMEEQRGGA